MNLVVKTKNITLEIESIIFDDFYEEWEIKFKNVYDEEDFLKDFCLNSEDLEKLFHINERAADEELLKILNIDSEILTIEQAYQYFYEIHLDDAEFDPDKIGYVFNEKIGWYEFNKD